MLATIIHKAHKIEAIRELISKLNDDQINLIAYIKYYLQAQYPSIDYSCIDIVDVYFEEFDEAPGNAHPSGTYFSEQVIDSLYCPDSGTGAQYIPISDNRYLVVEYEF